LNLPLPPGTGDARYLELFDEVIGPRLAQYQPELLLVSAGFDAHRDDPLAMMEVTEQGFAGMAARVRQWADKLCGGRLVLVLEGGYNLNALAASVEATLRALDDPSGDWTAR
jgi:acetoin utilization deacetylase AcuC-like enzyme